jgi:hypothetical protein
MRKTKYIPAIFPASSRSDARCAGFCFQVTAIDTTAALGALDLEVHYTPDAAETAQLHDPPLRESR